MPSRILAVLDERLVDRFVNGTASEHHDAEQELQHRLREIHRMQKDSPFTIAAPSGPGLDAPIVELELTAAASAAIQELQEATGDHSARLVRVQFWPGEFRLLVLVNAEVYHVTTDGQANRMSR